MTHLDQLLSFIEGSMGLEWHCMPNGYTAYNEITGIKLVISASRYPDLKTGKRDYACCLVLLLNPQDDILNWNSTMISTDDYSLTIDRALTNLYKHARITAQTKVFNFIEISDFKNYLTNECTK